MRPITLR